MNSTQRHLARFPHARKSTLEILTKRDATTERLKAEIAAARRRKLFARLLSWVWRRG